MGKMTMCINDKQSALMTVWVKLDILEQKTMHKDHAIKHVDDYQHT